MAADKLEVRGLYSRELVEAFDMIALSKGITRVDLLGRLVQAYVSRKQHEAMLVAKSPRINPPSLDTSWGELE